MEVKSLKLSSVHPSPMNPRKTFDEVALKELSENIRQQGLLQPITVRPVADNTEYEIVCGERRYRAYRILFEETEANNELPFNPWDEIMAIVKEMSDEEAFDAMITENLQRQDVDPMEEAFAFGQLQKKGSSIQDIALRFGKSIRFVQDRIKLNGLIPELMKEVKEDNMPISAAMVISKVDEERQRAYFKQYKENHYQGFTTATATSFVKALFLNLTDAVWNNVPDFAGGCDTSCALCPHNTANHGCLFYEMKAKDGQCTNVERYQAKTVAFIESYLSDISDTLVRAGEPLEKGKTVISISIDGYAPESVKKLKSAIRDKVMALGYEIVEPEKVFKSRNYYSYEDERTQAFLESGECYRVLLLANYNDIRPELLTYYVKKGDTATNVDNSGRPVKVQELLNKYKQAQAVLPASYIVQGCKALVEHGNSASVGLEVSEMNLAYALMIKSSRAIRKELGLDEYCSDSDIINFINANTDPKILCRIMRGWIKKQLDTGYTITPNEAIHLAEPYLESIATTWCPVQFNEAHDKVTEKFSKSEKKITAQLKALGYTIDGKKIETEAPAAETTPAKRPISIEKQFKEMKKKHPDALLIFRVNDYYELFNEDAEKAAELLQITITKRGKKMVAGFPHNALDTYVRKLTKAGVRVAVCEQLEAPKK